MLFAQRVPGFNALFRQGCQALQCSISGKRGETDRQTDRQIGTLLISPEGSFWIFHFQQQLTPRYNIIRVKNKFSTNVQKYKMQNIYTGRE